MQVTVLGFYNKQNLGDDLFVDAFKQLFPNIIFTFANELTSVNIKNADAIFIGGGSFLFSKPNISDKVLLELENKKIFYIGVGTETLINDTHLHLMKRAELIATRSPEKIDHLKDNVNENSFYCPDIVYCLESESSSAKSKTILLLPNMEVVSKHSDASWKHNAWEYFKSEYSQALDMLIDDGYQISSFAMCDSSKMNDNWATIEVMNKMNHRGKIKIVNDKFDSFKNITKFMSKFETIVTQRYHGIILSETMNKSYVSIHHHDKLKNAYPHNGRSISYYNFSKQYFLNEFYSTFDKSFKTVSIESNIFKELSEKVLKNM